MACSKEAEVGIEFMLPVLETIASVHELYNLTNRPNWLSRQAH